MQRYAPISKMEAQPDGTIKVWGIASTESVDNDGEVIKSAAMAAALPGYMEFGAIREMHGNIAAGTCLEAAVNAEGQTIICAHIVDEGSVKKVKTNVLKGFSIGGKALKTDPLNKTIVTELELNEISLVDKPANPDAVISLWKSSKMEPTPQQEAPLTGEQLGNHIEAAITEDGLSLQEVLKAVKGAVALKKKFKVDKAVECEHGAELGDKCDKCDNGFAMKKMDDDVDEFHKKAYDDAERATMATNGEAEADGSYPIKTEADLENAIHAFGRSKNKAKTKAHIISRAKALGLESKLPEKWHADESGEATNKVAGAVAPAGGSQEPAGNEATAKAATTGNTEAALEKTAGNAAVPAVGQNTQGAPNADNSQMAFGTNGTANPQADPPMLPKVAVGHLVSIKWGEDEVGGHIAEIRDLPDGGSEVVVKNGDAHLAVNSSKLVHHELNGDAVHWIVSAEDNAAFTAAKAAQTGRITAALQKAFRPADSLEKGFWTVGSWADSMQGLVWLMKDIKWEYVSEDDKSDENFVNRIGAAVRTLGELMLEYAEDQLKEVFTGICDPDNICELVIELAQKPGELQKAVNGDAKPTLGHILKKAFGANAEANVDVIDAAIQKAVGSAVAAATDKLEKAHKEQIDGLQAQIKTLEAQPEPIKGVLKGAAVNKDSNVAGSGEQEIQPVMQNGKVDEAATEFKKSFSQPQPFLRASQ
jgi:chaperonin cofactor prefoldin